MAKLKPFSAAERSRIDAMAKRLYEEDLKSNPLDGPSPMSGFGETVLNFLPGGTLLTKGLKGEQITGGDVALEAGLSLVPFGLGKIGKGLRASKATTGLTQKAGTGIEKLGGRMMNTQTNLSRAEMRRIGGSTPDMFMKMNSKYGLSKLDDIADISRNVTGREGVHSEAVRNVLFNGKGISTEDIPRTFENLLESKAPLISKSQREALKQQVSLSTRRMYADQPLNPLGNPATAFDVAQDFRGQARMLRTGASPSAADKQLSQVYDGLGEAIEKKLYSQPEVAEAIPLVRQNMVQQYQQLAQSAGPKTLKGKAYNKLAQEAAEITSPQDLRSAQKIWVQANKVEEKTAEAAGNAATKMAGGGGLIQRAGNALLDAANPVIGAGASKLGSALQRGGSPQGLIGRSTGLVADHPILSQIGVRVPGALMGAGDDRQDPESLLNQPLQGPGDASLTQEDFQDLLMNDMLETGGRGQEAIKQMAKMYGIGDEKKISATQQKGVLAMQNATSQVDQLESLFNEAGGGQGILGGNIANFAGGVGLNDPAKVYNDKRAGAGVIIARALGEAGTMTEGDIQRAVSQIPSINENPDAAARKWQAIRQLLSTIGQNTLDAPTVNGGQDLLQQTNGGY